MKKALLNIATVAFAFNIPAPTIASFYTGNDLWGHCSASHGSPTYYQKDAYCTGFIIGVADTNGHFSASDGVQKFCLARNVTAGQLRDVTLSYLQRHPERRHYAASSLVIDALKNAFPC